MQDNIGRGEIIGIGNFPKFQQEPGQHSNQDNCQMNQENLSKPGVRPQPGHKGTQIGVDADADKQNGSSQGCGISFRQIIERE